MAELVDAADLKSASERSGGSSPPVPTIWRFMKVLIPSCLKLDEKQIEALQNWFSQFEYDEDKIEDCCGTGHTFHVSGSGIGDSILVEHGGRKFDVGYDDGGEIVGEINF